MSQRVLLCGVADDDQAPGLVAFATELAYNARFNLVVAHIADVRAPVPARIGTRSAHAHAALLPHELAPAAHRAYAAGDDLLRRLDVADEASVVAVGDAYEQLLRLGRECDAALIVVGTRGRGLLRSVLQGTVSRSLATRGDRPVVVVRPAAAARLTAGSVVCGVTADAASAPAVARVAADLAERLELPLAVSHVLDINDHLDAEIDASLSALLDSQGWTALKLMRAILDEFGDRIDARAVLRRGDPVDELIALARDSDAALIVAGSRGHGPLRTLLEGSISLELCHRAPCPVVIVPPKPVP